MWTTILTVLLAITGVVLMFIILLQRGRGGGLAGAFGAMGGQSAFGTKPGDVFTRITIGIAVVWVALAAGAGIVMRTESGGRFRSDVAPELTDQKDDKAAPVDGGKVEKEQNADVPDAAPTQPAKASSTPPTPPPTPQPKGEAPSSPSGPEGKIK